MSFLQFLYAIAIFKRVAKPLEHTTLPKDHHITQYESEEGQERSFYVLPDHH